VLGLAAAAAAAPKMSQAEMADKRRAIIMSSPQNGSKIDFG
jgi:hypothetical protein